MERLKKQYRWGHLSEREYLDEFQKTESQIKKLSPLQHREGELERLAEFPEDVAATWREASQEQRNKLARVLFEEVRLDSGGRVVALKPIAKLQPFFRLSYECQARNIACNSKEERSPSFLLIPFPAVRGLRGWARRILRLRPNTVAIV